VGAEPKIERLATGLRFTEGPIWTLDQNLIFSDIPANVLYVWDGKELKVWREKSNNANGNTLDLEGNLITCEHGSRTVTRTDKTGKVTILAATYEGKKLNSPNDITVHRSGVVFFTDPPYGISRDQQEQLKNGVYRLDQSGKITMILDSLDRPNGIVLSPDEKILYIADTAQNAIFAMKVDEKGMASEPKRFADSRNPDGLRMDLAGNLWVAAGNGVQIIAPNGKEIGVLALPEPPANLTFGEDGQTLFATARTSLYRIRLATKGIMPGFPR
jgi:gluconolactonase